MKLSKRTDYALRVLCTLAAHDRRSPLSMTQLASRNDVPKRFLEHIMLDLKNQGWVESSTGRKGGYILAQSPERITMGQVVRHFDRLTAPKAAVSVTRHKPCEQGCHCRFRRVLLEIRKLTTRYLDNTTLAYIAGVE